MLFNGIEQNIHQPSCLRALSEHYASYSQEYHTQRVVIGSAGCDVRTVRVDTLDTMEGLLAALGHEIQDADEGKSTEHIHFDLRRSRSRRVISKYRNVLYVFSIAHATRSGHGRS